MSDPYSCEACKQRKVKCGRFHESAIPEYFLLAHVVLPRQIALNRPAAGVLATTIHANTRNERSLASELAMAGSLRAASIASRLFCKNKVVSWRPILQNRAPLPLAGTSMSQRPGPACMFSVLRRKPAALMMLKRSILLGMAPFNRRSSIQSCVRRPHDMALCNIPLHSRVFQTSRWLNRRTTTRHLLNPMP